MMSFTLLSCATYEEKTTSTSSDSSCQDNEEVDDSVQLQVTHATKQVPAPAPPPPAPPPPAPAPPPRIMGNAESIGEFTLDDNAQLSGLLPEDDSGAVSGQILAQPNELTNCASEYCLLTLTTRVIHLKSTSTYTRGFDGGVGDIPIGPTLRIKPGDTLKVKLHNALTLPNPSPEEVAKANGKRFDKKQHFIGYLNGTNIHTHGLHVSGSKFPDRTEDFIFAMVKPGDTRQYDIQLPADHMAGLHWYHSHHHHSTALQSAGGAAGLIVVEDPVGYLPEEISNMKEVLMIMTLVDEAMIANVGAMGGDQIMKIPKGAKEKNVYVNGQLVPTMTVRPGEWMRLRMCFSAIEMAVRGHMISDDSTAAQCEMHLLAKDGIYLHKMPRKISTVSLFPGARADFALRCTCPGGAATCSTKFHSNDAPRQNWGAFAGDIFNIQVEGQAVASAALTQVEVARPCYLVDLRNEAMIPKRLAIKDDNVHELEISTNQKSLRWKQCKSCRKGNWKSMPWFSEEPTRDQQLINWKLGTLTPGEVHEFTFWGFRLHPFHLHINPYQIQAWAGRLNDDYFHSGDWHDVLMDPKSSGQVRLQTDRFTKEMVVHCHFLRHEDSGMMGWFWITEPEGGQSTFWEGAKIIDPKCYRGEHFKPDSGSPTPQPTPAPTPSPTPSPTIAGQCLAFCNNNRADWEVKCKWTAFCGDCHECFD